MPRLATFFLMAFCFVACNRQKESEDLDVRKSADTFKWHKSFAAAIQQATNAILYEGLPHPSFQRAIHMNELATKATVVLGEHPFYSEPLPLEASDAEKLRGLYCNSSSFQPFAGFKLCGGYHPDYCIEWRTGTETSLVQICFGCHEMKTFSGGEMLQCDISPAAFEMFGAVLKSYRKNRPPETMELNQ